ncbi:hypothetical protein AMAG_07279 [Allomyces macrogynus ATCC 38327]|uniref:Uncharacterized protein n=1 Tax=Allomyces macrogynus (strain ATCC 38327) TaxID=578462 RepID=A0A0L0SHP0_ALLM3|nr:hypothetical protein AMAG_07279 [Allomyces macrogynus ATCC 38327]|eukprot:KNE62021.1 hypothetical protein AMAG_07279 [Allomyces macrogynus ATCC 38327]
MTQTPLAEIDTNEVVLCARYGELPELKEEVARLQHEYPHVSVAALLAQPVAGGNTPLHMAAANGHKDIVEYLLQHLVAVSVNTQNEQGNTPMHWCAVNGHDEIAKLLIAAGAELTLVNHAGRTALYEAQAAEHEKVAVELLKVMDPDLDEDAEDDTAKAGPSSSSASEAPPAAQSTGAKSK